jgi:serine protease Do
VAGPLTPKLQSPESARALSDAFASVAQAIRPSVVRLDVEGMAPAGAAGGGASPTPDVPDFLRRFFEFGDAQPNPWQQPPAAPQQRTRGTGSGVIIDPAGNVLTNGHVLSGARKVTIQLADGRTFDGRVVGADPLTDVGVVRFQAPPPHLVAARLATADEQLRIGEWAIAVGSPLGMDQTVTAGIISGVGETGRRFRFASGQRVRKYIQTDAAINPGNSGGPLVNLQGEVIGINTLINVGPGGSYGFAIPIQQASEVARVIIKEGRVRYPYLGVSVVGLEDAPQQLRGQLGDKAPKEGALVTAVTRDAPAARAGLEPADVIVEIGGHPVKSAADVVDAVSAQKIGGTVTIGYVRDGANRSAAVKVGEYPGQAGTEGGRGGIGVALQTLTPQIADALGLEPATKGAVITEVSPGSPAAQAGLAPGDVIREIDKKPITSAQDAVAAMASGKGARLLRVTNASGSRFVTVVPR